MLLLLERPVHTPVQQPTVTYGLFATDIWVKFGLIHLRNVVVQIAQTLVILFDQESERVTKTGVA
jgi:hypothetical protein